ncbi:MAG: transglutaminase family protein [Phreatobacter sp.]|uniref:transglutaminase family protein n=1 Tax=Phreatobacter sp. TaxID=1966341 RepID=UPI0027338F82|nr:transglutaminase family protein [Phreatobacter sp.]MDP2803397.1 transglutaminase family protein [Phreatobacter sp.]
MDLHVRHVTTYRYAGAVQFGPHKLMLRPRDSFDMRILDTQIEIFPRAELHWSHDVYGNTVAVATFADKADRLEITSGLVLRRYASAFPRGRTSASALFVPHYADGERIVLQPFMTPATGDDEGVLAAWIAEVLSQGAADEDPLARLSRHIHSGFGYSVRFEEGTQAPSRTLSVRSGSCRDLAWLFIEAVRRLGYGARFVSGYLHNSANDDPSNRAAVGLTHAWAEVFVPGDGWVEFDPTNALVADPHLIRVAVARVPWDASPVAGSFVGPVGAQISLSVGVDIASTQTYSNVA